ncbi:MAG: DsbA family protein [Myxococcales bacterium]
MNRVALPALLAAALLAACTKAHTPASSGTAQSQSGMSPDTVVATYADKKVTLGEVDASISKELYDARRQAVETLILRRLIQEEAKKVGKDEESFLKGIVEAGVTVPEEEIRAIYEQNKDQMGGKSYEEMKPMIERRLQQDKQRDAVMAYVDQLKRNAKVEIMLPEPRVEVAAVGPSKGPENAPITIVEFSDFECPYCSRAKKTVDKVMADYAGKVRLVWRDFPLPFHAKAPKASEAAHCAGDQGKFWEFHDSLFDNQEKLSIEDLKATAKNLGLDTAKFDQCLDSGQYAGRIAENVQAGREAGVSGTPAFFINGKMISGAQPYEEFKRVIDSELKSN